MTQADSDARFRAMLVEVKFHRAAGCSHALGAEARR
jgi:hypothetical protein